MRRFLPILAIPLLMLFLFAGNTMALNISGLGTNITINDGIPDAMGYGIGSEDDEVEKNSIESQIWDQEGVFWDGTILSFVGGFNYQAGVGEWDTGDVFIGNYALDLDRVEPDGDLYGNNGKFALIEDYTSIDKPTQTHALESSPWLYKAGGISVGVGTYQIVNVDNGGYFRDWGGNSTRWALRIDGGTQLANIIDSGALIHLTLECGNDTIHASVPEPSGMFLLGTGLIGLAGLGRKKIFK